ncbi:PHP domain-containing protein [Nocardioides rotundus]|uniref:PHP domain-containing protein n=1 Tax=Nocardioides rotundus TaxID=1774216 RepID=UPI001CBF2DBF|nr:PHP domain-containing protein [Nocardioides rotundus]UAL31137.1 PHP domain-containing protein [Nocardioides rotundus]
MRIDLHTHSLHSDGSDAPRRLVELAVDAGLDVVALTDHDTVAGWEEARAAGEELGIQVILGAEFSTSNQDRGQHLLGYGFDPDHRGIAEILRRGASARADRADALFERLSDLGLGVDREYVVSLAGGIPSRKHVAAGMVRAGHVASDDEAFARYLNEGGPAYIPRYRPTIEEAIRAIGSAGGVSVIAHPWDTRRGEAVTEARFAALAASGLDGIEVDHQQHSEEDRAALRSIAADLSLAATGSSDYHGTRKTNHDLGCHLTDPEVAGALLGLDLT